MKINNDDHGQFTGPGEVRLVRTLPGPINRVWEYLTDPEKRARWFAGGPMELKAGGKYTLHMKHQNLAPDEVPPEDHKKMHYEGMDFTGRVLRSEPPRLLSYTFDDESEVTFELKPEGDRVILVLTHRSRGTDLPFLHGYASGWHTHLAMLVAELEGAPRPPFWATHARLKPEYDRLYATTPKN